MTGAKIWDMLSFMLSLFFSNLFELKTDYVKWIFFKKTEFSESDIFQNTLEELCASLICSASFGNTEMDHYLI